MSLKDAYLLRVNDFEEEGEVVMNRIRLRKYLREFDYFSR
jgi:hypothetical protein